MLVRSAPFRVDGFRSRRTRPFSATAGSPPPPSARSWSGPGDDAAVLAPVRNERLVVTTDAVVEGVHFSRAFSTPADIGHKALAVNLSDLAAMAATPRWALLSLVLPGSWLVADVEESGGWTGGPGGSSRGVGGRREYHAHRRPAGRRRHGRRRSGVAAVADPGGALRGSRNLRQRHDRRRGGRAWRCFDGAGSREPGAEIAGTALSVARACARPEPRVRLGMAMGRARAARAAMDLSDGLADALRQVAAASGVRRDGSMPELLPIDPGARAWWASRGIDPVAAAVKGGDDYELLFAVPARRAAARYGQRAAARFRSAADEDWRFYEGPARARGRRARASEERVTGRFTNTLESLESLSPTGERAIATLCVATVFVLLYEIQTRDSRREASVPTVMETTVLPQAGARMQFSATAYCKGETTASGVGVRTGIAAADPAILPVGSVVRLETPEPALQRRLDGDGHRPRRARPERRPLSLELQGSACSSAAGSIRLTVLRLGWNPENSIPGMVDTLFRKREAESKKPAPAPPIPRPRCRALDRCPRSEAPR